MPQISIIVPTYNSENYVNNLIKSINNQTFQDYEVIIIDNLSSDKTFDKIKKEDLFYNKCKFYPINNEGCIAKSRNYGIQKSNGKYIAFHDSDDFWYNNKLEICLNEINNKDFVYHDLRINNKNNLLDFRKLYSYDLSSINGFNEMMTKSNPISTSSVMCKRSIFEKIKFSEDKRLITVEDYDCWINISKNEYKFKYIQKVLGSYYINSENTSKTHKLNNYKYLRIFNKYRKYLPNDKLKILSKNNFRYLVANSLKKKKVKKKYFFYLLFSKIIKSKVKIFTRLVFTLF